MMYRFLPPIPNLLSFLDIWIGLTQKLSMTFLVFSSIQGLLKIYLQGVWNVLGRFLKGGWKVQELDWRVFGGWLEGVRKVFGMFLEGVWNISGKCQEGFWKVSEGFPKILFNPKVSLTQIVFPNPKSLLNFIFFCQKYFLYPKFLLDQVVSKFFSTLHFFDLKIFSPKS